MDIKQIARMPLLSGISERDLSICINRLWAREKSFEKGTIILHAGSTTQQLGVILSGSVTIESSDVWGNCTILSHLGVGDVFAETYALLPDSVMLVDVRANENCKILFLKVSELIKYRFYDEADEILIKNLLLISSQKNLALSGRSFHTAPKSARARILAYLNSVSLQRNEKEFDIPFNRQQLADYLNLERTNMSKELSKMQKEGLIRFRKNHFVLLSPM